MERKKEGRGFRVFMKNPYWREYYENAPSKELKEFIALQFEYSYLDCKSEKESEAIHIAHKKIESILSVTDFDYLIKHTGNTFGKIHYHECIKKIIEASELHTVFHIPHDGDGFPAELMSAVIVPSEVFTFYHEAMRDADVKRLIPDMPNSETIEFNVSRLLCDVERLTDGTEIMEKYGMGFCYEKVYDGTIIKKISSDLKERTYKYYKVHHDRIDESIQKHPEGVLFIDLHSFSGQILVGDVKSGGKPIPDICLGYDERFCSPLLLELANKYFTEYGFTVGVNYPYSGSYIPDCILGGQADMPFDSIMIEVNKAVYIRDGAVDNGVAWKIKRAIFTTVARYTEMRNESKPKL